MEGKKKGRKEEKVGREEGKKIFYLMTHSTHFIYSYSRVGYMDNDHTDSERKPAATTLWATLFN